ncbi:chorismate mutase [Actinosynnema sp.]|uniref:chorismate mutase n=1 Tax=Actinosynnema sp. TaxID=1872144 RepID=UPI003F879854
MAEVLGPFRERINQLDEQLAEVVAARLRVCAEVAAVKKTKGIPMMQPDRGDAVREAYAARGSRMGISPEFMRQLAAMIVAEACRVEDEIIDGDTESHRRVI